MNEIFEIYLALCGVLIAIASLFLIRNQIIYKIRIRAIDYVFDSSNCENLRPRLNNPDYEQMMYQWNKWTFKQFYPDFKD